MPRAYTLLFDGASTPQLIDRGSGAGGAQGDADSSAPAISTDGSTAVFASRSDNLGAGGGRDFGRVYARRLASDQLELVSRPDGTGTFASGVRESQIEGRAISADGRFVAFESQTDNLAPGENSIVQGVFVRDTLTGTTTLVSRANGAGGAAADANSTVDGISSDGRRVLFDSSASNLGAPSSGSVVYVRDLVSNTTTVISRANGVDGTVVQAQGLDISGDGNRVVFLTAATLDPDARDGIHIYVRDIAANRTIFVDRDNGVRGQPIDGEPLDASIDHDGQRVVWTSDERRSVIPTHIVVRLRDLQQNTTSVVSRGSAPPGDPAGGDPANADAADPRIDGAGNVIAFRSAATNLGVAVTHQAIWVRNLDTGATQLASRATGAAGDPADADSQTPSLDDAGDRLAFTSVAGNLGNPAPSIFDAHSYVRDLSAGSTELVSRDDGTNGSPAAQPGFTVVSLSGNGNCAAFSARSLTLGDGFASADFSSVHVRVLRGECPVVPTTGGGGGTQTGGGGVGNPPPPAPAALSRLAVRPARFHVTGHKRGTTISFRLTRDSPVTLTFERVVAGHRKGRHCVAHARKGRRCTIDKRVGRLTIARARAGADAVRFIGRLRGKVLAPGRYRLIATPARGRSRTVAFTVLPAAHRGGRGHR